MILEAVTAARGEVSESLLVAGFANRSLGAVEQAITAALEDASKKHEPRIREALLDVLAQGGEAAAKQMLSGKAIRASASPAGVTRTKRSDTGSIQAQFDRKNPKAEKWAAERSAQLVVEINGRTRQAIQRVVRNSFAQGKPPREAARQLRSFVGLTRAQMRSVDNLDLRLRGNAGNVVYAGSLRIRVPQEGASEAFIEKWTKRYSERLLKYRTENIARTEVMAASNEGQRQLWQQSIASGYLPQNARRTWITTDDDRLCPICEEMDGQVVLVAENFETPEGESVTGPPAHPSCRCAQGITDEPVSGGD